MDSSAYQILEPVTELQPYVRRLLVADSPIAINETIYPAPTGYNYLGWIFAGLVSAKVNEISLTSSQTDKLHISGQIQYQEIEIHYSGRLGHILAECTATGFYELTGIPGEKIYAASRNLEFFAPDLTRQIDSVLATVTDRPATNDRATHRVEIFQHQLCTLIQGAVSVPDYISETVKRIENVDGCIQVSDIADQLAVSPRQLRRKFKEIVGVTPKYFAKVLQMNKSLFALYNQEHETLAILSQEAGFYDQAHFINVMQQFFAAGPQEFINSSEPLLSTFLGKSRNSP